jgi:hypothetical protein
MPNIKIGMTKRSDLNGRRFGISFALTRIAFAVITEVTMQPSRKKTQKTA